LISDYDYNVFINCPFDDQYSTLFDAILFTVYKCGFRPRCSKEVQNAGDIRIEVISKIISECRFGIHDISRVELDRINKLPRFNMPLELGMFLGAKKFGPQKQQTKIIMIFDKEKYRYQKFISDIAGQDIYEHKFDEKILIKSIRNTLNSSKINGPIEGANSIIDSYKKFQRKLPTILNNLKLKVKDVEYADKTQMIEQYITLTP
jgi:hypothetical protein